MSEGAAGPAHAAAARSPVRGLLLLAVGLGTGLQAAGFLVDGPEPWAAGAAVVPAAVWAAGRRHYPVPAADAWLAMSVILAGVGLWLGVGASWMVPAVVAGLAAWDLARLEQRLGAAGHVEGGQRLAARHLAYLLPVMAVGLVLALVGARVRLDLGFLPILLLGALAVASLARMVVYLRHDQ